jgi:hypothetical protein
MPTVMVKTARRRGLVAKGSCAVNKHHALCTARIYQYVLPIVLNYGIDP